MQSLKFALQPAVINVSLNWDLPKEASVTVLSPPITSIFHGQRSLVYAQLSGLVRDVDVTFLGFLGEYVYLYVCIYADQLCAVFIELDSSRGSCDVELQPGW